MQETCDMHIHTDNSDGILSGIELLKLAKKRRLRKLSITDHDCVDFYLDEKNIEMLKDFDYIPGCEFVCSCGNVPIEILGYGININDAKKYLDLYGVTENKMDRYRNEHAPKAFEKHGISLNYDPNSIDFTQKCPNVLDKLYDAVLQNPKAVEFLQQENPNILQSVSSFLREGINNPSSKIFIEPNTLYPTCDKITNLIRQLGGLSFLAHPYQYGDNMLDVLEETKHLVDGIECYHNSTQEESKIEFLKNFCNQHNLMISGGSDFHSPLKKDRALLNKLNIPAQYFDDIKSKLTALHSKNK